MQNKDRIVRKSEKISFLKRLKALLISQKSALKSDIHFDIHLPVKVNKTT